MNSNNNRKFRNKNPKNSNFKNAPIVIIRVSPEELVYKNEDEIRFISDKMNKNLRLARTQKDDKSVKSIEKEICYVQREVNHREKRKKAHENFISK